MLIYTLTHEFCRGLGVVERLGERRFFQTNLKYANLDISMLTILPQVNERAGGNPDVGKYLGIYFALGVGSSALVVLQTLILWIFCSIEVSYSGPAPRGTLRVFCTIYWRVAAQANRSERD